MSNVPKIRFKEFSREWESKKLGDITECLDNKRKPLNSKEREKIKGNIPYYGANGIVDFIDDYIFNEKIVLLAEDGGNFDDFSTKPIAQLVTNKSWVNNHAHVLKAKFNTEFLFYSLVHKDIRKYINGTSRSKLNKLDMLSININIPSLQEQEKIASFLSLIDDKISLQSEKVKYLKDYKKGLMQKIFSRKLRFKDENGNDYPEWEEKKLGEILSIPDKIKENYICKDRLLTVKLHRKGIQVNENTETLNIGSTVYYKRKAGQLIYGKQNFFNGAIDIIPDKLDGFISSGDVPSLDINENIANGKFILGYIGRESFYKKTEALATGTGSKRLHENILFEININLPCLDEQNKISNLLSSVDKKIEKEQEKLDSLNEYKKGLLQQMFV